VRVDASLGR